MTNFAFIDSQNLNLGVADLGWKLDFARFRVYLREKYSVEQAYLFIGYIRGNERLYTRLQTYGYVCVFKPTLELPDGRTKGNVDAELVLHTMIQLENFNKAVIVTGDGDFHCLVEYLRDSGKLEKVLVPNQFKYSVLLKRLSTPRQNLFDFLNPLRGRLEFKLRRNEKGSRRDRTRREPFSS